MPLSDDQNSRIQAWAQAAQTAKQWAEYERKLRDALCSELFAGNADGTFHLELGGGYALKLLRTTRYKVTPSPHLNQVMYAAKAHAPVKDIADQLFKFKPELVRSAYNDAPEWLRKHLDQDITTIPNAPQLTLETPKG